MTNMIWTLDDEGRLKVVWITPVAAKAVVNPPRFRRVARAAYGHIQTSLARRSAA